MSYVVLNVEACNKSTNSCAPLELKLSQTEFNKIQLATSSKAETVDYSNYYEFWTVSFSITLSFWIIAKIAGVVLSFFKR